MNTHLEASGLTVKEVVDERDTFSCSKGHRWEETLENRFGDLFLPISFPFPNSKMLCPFCLSDFFSNIGRVSIKTEKEVE